MGRTDDFEWDDAKNAETRAKRDLELIAAARIFDGRFRLERVSPKSTATEIRYETMAEVDARVLFCVWTWRGSHRRIMSLRPAHRSERRAYKEAIGGG
jgi:uncharacterized protein